MMMHLGAVAVKSTLAGEQRASPIGGGTRLAQRGTAFRARQAVPAARNKDHDDMVADLEIVDSRSELFHDARGFVAEHHRSGPRAIAVDDGEIGMAQACGGNPDQHLPVTGIVELHLLDRQRL